VGKRGADDHADADRDRLRDAKPRDHRTAGGFPHAHGKERVHTCARHGNITQRMKAGCGHAER